jgi:hypothetical protein
MTVYFGGGEADALTGQPQCVELASAGSFDSTYSRGSLGFTGSAVNFTDYWSAFLIDPSTTAVTNVTTLWFHAEHLSTNTTGGTNITLFQCVNSSGTPVFRCFRTSVGSTFQMQFWDGAAWQNAGSTFTITTGTRQRFDLKLICGASGSFEFYINEVLTANGSITDADTNNVKELRLCFGSSTQGAAAWSQIIVASVSTIGWKLHTKPPTGNGGVTTWTGAFGDVDEVVNSDGDFIESVNNDEVETYTHAALTLTGTVKAVIAGARSKTGGAGPTNMQMVLRKSGTNYPSGNVGNLNGTYQGNIAIWQLDPSTGVAWVPADAASTALESGVKSKA